MEAVVLDKEDSLEEAASKCNLSIQDTGEGMQVVVVGDMPTTAVVLAGAITVVVIHHSEEDTAVTKFLEVCKAESMGTDLSHRRLLLC